MREAGLVNAVVPPEDVERAALSAAAALARKPRQALAMARALMRGESDRLMLRITEEAEAFRKGLSSPEARAAFEAFLNRGRG
jgi:enoyl-CoA hydratase/carnithine racemase